MKSTLKSLQSQLEKVTSELAKLNKLVHGSDMRKASEAWSKADSLRVVESNLEKAISTLEVFLQM